MTLYTQNAEEYRDFLNDFEIEQTDTLITAWDTFDQEHPGEYKLRSTDEVIVNPDFFATWNLVKPTSR